jgi:hypothetical protein
MITLNNYSRLLCWKTKKMIAKTVLSPKYQACLLALTILALPLIADSFDYEYFFLKDEAPDNITFLNAEATIKACDVYEKKSALLNLEGNTKNLYDNLINSDNVLILYDIEYSRPSASIIKLNSSKSTYQILSTLYYLSRNTHILKEFSNCIASLKFMIRYKKFQDFTDKELVQMQIEMLKLRYFQKLAVQNYIQCLIILDHINALNPDSEFYFQEKLKIFIYMNDATRAKALFEHCKGKKYFPQKIVADYYLFNKDYKKAEKFYKAAVKINYRDYSAREGLIKSYLFNDYIKKTRKLLPKLLSDFPRKTEPLILNAFIHYKNGNHIEELNSLKKAEIIDPLDVNVKILKIKAESNNNQKNNSHIITTRLDSLISAFPANPVLITEYFIAYLKNYKCQSNLWEEAFSIEKYPPAINFEAYDQIVQGILKEPLMLFYKLSPHKNNNDWLYYLDNICLSTYHHSPQIDFIIAIYLYKYEKYLYAPFFLKRNLTYFPDNIDALILLCECYRNLGIIENSEKQIKKILDLNPTDPAGLFLLNQFYLSIGDHRASLIKRTAGFAYKWHWIYNGEKLNQNISSLLSRGELNYYNIIAKP